LFSLHEIFRNRYAKPLPEGIYGVSFVEKHVMSVASEPAWKRRWSLVPAAVWAGVILILSTGPGIQVRTPLVAPDKVGHLAAYGLLVWLLLWGFRHRGRLGGRRIWGSILGSALYGFLMELLQYGFFPGRYFEVLDIVANITGCFLGWLIFSFSNKNLKV